jgi:hypothetical protein
MTITRVKLIPREIIGMEFPEATLLTTEQQAKYEEAVKSFANSENARNNLNIPNKGSNLFKVIFLNQIGIRTATLPELDLIAETSPDFLRGTYEDAPAVVLRSVEDSNSNNGYIAKSLASLVRKRNFSHAVVIEGLKLKEDSQSAYGLSFEKGDSFRVIEAPAFDHANNQKRFVRINQDYSVDFDDKGQRTFYTRQNGVSRLYLSWNLDACSNVGNLAGSDDGGRVVLVSG